jgi:type I restriction enzyme S subunit
MRLKVDESVIQPVHAINLLNTPVVLRQLQRRAKDAVAQSSINQQDVKAIRLPVPPVEEQRRIIKRARVQTEQILAERAYRGKLHRLKTGLMQDLLTGRKRVPEIEEQVAEALA